MRSNSHIFFLMVLGIFSLFSCDRKQVNKPPIRIATSANMHATMQALVSDFEKRSQLPCEIMVGSSGKLTAQIIEGAPYDIFVAADMKYPQELYDAGHTISAPKAYASGNLILWSGSKEGLLNMDILADNDIKHIAIANPKTAPYGRASMDVLNYYKVYDQVKDKLVYGESISQTNQFILSHAAEIGITAMSVVLAPELKNKGQWVAIDESSYTPIVQGAVLLKKRVPSEKGAEDFYNFLYSPEAKQILKKHGYSVNE